MIKRYVVKDLQTWAKTNHAFLLDDFPGSLLDNELYACKHGIAVVMEQYETSWTSKRVLVFARSNNIPDQWELWEMWDKMKDAAEKAMEEEEKRYLERMEVETA